MTSSNFSGLRWHLAGSGHGNTPAEFGCSPSNGPLDAGVDRHRRQSPGGEQLRRTGNPAGVQGRRCCTDAQLALRLVGTAIRQTAPFRDAWESPPWWPSRADHRQPRWGAGGSACCRAASTSRPQPRPSVLSPASMRNVSDLSSRATPPQLPPCLTTLELLKVSPVLPQLEAGPLRAVSHDQSPAVRPDE